MCLRLFISSFSHHSHSDTFWFSGLVLDREMTNTVLKPNSRYWADDDWDSVSWFEWNLAAKRCQDVDGWSKEALYKIREGYFFKDSNKHLLPPESGTMQSSVIDHLEKASQIGKTIFSYFKSSQGKPYTGQGAMIPRRVFLHR